MEFLFALRTPLSALTPSNREQQYPGNKAPGAMAGLLVLILSSVVGAAPLISEFMALNDSSLKDEDGEYSDWIEIHNPEATAVDLTGWYLTDRSDDLAGWAFPATVLPPGGYLLVFASGKNRAFSGRELHANFKLSGGGEFLALVKPDGVTVVSSYAPYPQQQPDIAYGLGFAAETATVLAAGAAAAVHVPNATSGPKLGNNWQFASYPEGANGETWLAATSGTGFDQSGTMTSLIGAGGDIGPQMFNMNPGVYARFAFDVADAAAVDGLTLRMRYDDGFAAYLNGEEIAASNAPGSSGLTSYQQAVVADQPILYWTFDEAGDQAKAECLVNPSAANELSPQGNATRVDSTTTGGGASLGRAASFDGNVGARFFAPDLARSDPPMKHYAVELWFRTNSGAAQYLSETFTEGGTANTSSLIYGYGAGKFEIFSGDRSGTLVPANAWHHLVVGVYGSAEPQFYVNGALAANTAGGNFNSPWAFGAFSIGNATFANNPFTGQIDEYAVYDLTGLADTAARMAKVAAIAAHHAVPPTGDELEWNSAASADRDDGAALVAQSFSLNARRDLLQTGTNLLAIHGVNAAADSPDFLLLPELEVARLTVTPGTTGYLTEPTPGEANRPGSSAIGPVISGVAHAPAAPSDTDPIVVTASISKSFAPVGGVTLSYRIGYGEPVAIPMNDIGEEGDFASGDGIFTATIPAGTAAPGQMLRWKISATDTGGTSSVSPAFLDPTNSPEYHGTMVADPAAASALPILYWFVQNPAAAETGSGTRASLYYNREFYDNVFVRIRGATARNWPKKSYKFDFNRRDHFRFHPAEARVEEININGTYIDKSYVRSLIGYDTFRDAGVPACATFPLRIQQNGAFHSVAHFVEQVDEDYLERNGLDPAGALYKANFNTLGGGDELGAGTNGMDKKTRLHEDKSDMQALIDGVGLGGDPLRHYLFDHIDLPAVVNFMAASVVIQDVDRWATNFYLYRDSEGTGEWMFLPWDLDLTFGPDQNATNVIVANQDTGLNASHPLLGSERFPYSRPTLWNGLLDAMFRDPRTLEMFYRRVRTLSDAFLTTGYYAAGIDGDQAAMAADVLLDRARWGAKAHFGGTTLSMQAEGNRIKNEYVIPRRTHLLVTHGGASKVPAPQPEAPAVAFGAIEFNPASGVQDEEYVELVNPNAFAVDLSGWKVSGGIAWIIKPGTVIPAGGSLYLSPDPSAFRSRPVPPTGGEGHFVQGGYDGHLSNFGEAITLRNASDALMAETVSPSALSDPQRYLVVSEILYHPLADPEAEFIELLNISKTVTLDLTGVKFSRGIDFAFSGSAISTLGPGERVLVVRNEAAFRAAYGNGFPVAGAFANATALNNGGETIKLDDATNSTIREFTYRDAPPWPASADGIGPSLVLIRPAAGPDHDDPSNWRPSVAAGGNPGVSDATVFSGDAKGDLDANGLPDLIDYLMGNGGAFPDARPVAGSSVLEVGGQSAVYATLSFRRSVAAEDVFEAVEVSSDLMEWRTGDSAVVRHSLIDHGNGTASEVWRSVQPSGTGARRLFLRLRGTLDP
jgi:hypothetical protein